MTARCIGEPVSWLRLERYHLGELTPDALASVEAHLAACPACAACLEQIRADDGAALPPLSLPTAKENARVVRLSFTRVAPLLGTLGVAALVLLGVGRGWRRGAPVPLGSASIKGGDVAFVLAREDGSFIADERARFREGERFEVVVTCPPGLHSGFDVVVYDRGGASFPLASAPVVACGNGVRLPGAFALTGEDDEEVCLVWGEASPPDRRVLQGGPPSGDDVRCKTLTPGQ